MNATGVLDARAQRTVLVGMVAYVALGAFESLAVSTAMPAVVVELDGLRLYTYAFAATSGAAVVGMVTAGRWTDRRGPASPMGAGIAAFLAGLLLAGLAPSMAVLLAGRVLQGVGTGLTGVALLVLVARVFPAERRPRVFAWFAAAWVIPGVVGPAVAGLVTQQLGWRWVFLAVPVLAVPALLALRPGLVAARARSGHGPGGTGAGGDEPATPARVRDVVGPVLRGARGLGTVVLVRALVSAAFVGAEVLISLALVRERGLGLALAGSVLTLSVLGWSAGSWLRGRGLGATSHAGFLRIVATGIALGIAGIALLTVPGVPLPAAVAPWALAGFGMGISYPTLNLLALELAPRAGQGTAMSTMQVADAAAAALALTGTGALLWSLHDRLGVTAFAVCLLAAATLAAVAALLAGRTRPQAIGQDGVTNSLDRTSSFGEAGDESVAAPASS